MPGRCALIFALSLPLLSSAQAQRRTQLGVQAGAGLSWTQQRGAAPPSSWQRPSGQVGMVAETRLSNQLALQYGLGIALKAYRSYSDGVFNQGTADEVRLQATTTTHLTYAQVQAVAVFAPAGLSRGVRLLLGGYGSMGVWGRSSDDLTETRPTESRSYGSNYRLRFGYSGGSGGGFGLLGGGGSADIRPFDAGLLGGVGYRRGAVQVAACYEWGLGQLLPGYLERRFHYQAYLRGASLTATYYLPATK